MMAMVALQAFAQQQSASPRNPIEEILTMNPTQQRGLMQRLNTLRNLDQTEPSRSSSSSPGGVTIEEVPEESTSNGGPLFATRVDRMGVEAKASIEVLPEAVAVAGIDPRVTALGVAAPKSDDKKETPKSTKQTPEDAAKAILNAMQTRKENQAKRKAAAQAAADKAAVAPKASSIPGTAAATTDGHAAPGVDVLKRPSCADAGGVNATTEPDSKIYKMDVVLIAQAMTLQHEKSIKQYLFRAPSVAKGGPGTKATPNFKHHHQATQRGAAAIAPVCCTPARRSRDESHAAQPRLGPVRYMCAPLHRHFHTKMAAGRKLKLSWQPKSMLAISALSWGLQFQTQSRTIYD